MFPLLFSQHAQGEACPVTFLATPELRGKIAFSYRQDGLSYLCFYDFILKQTTLVYRSKEPLEYPDWSPDAKHLVFYGDLSGDREIFSIRADGTDLRQLTHSPGVDEDPSWSPRGNLIVFSSARAKKNSQNVFVMDTAGNGLQQLTFENSLNTVPKWSNDGQRITFSTNRFWPGWDVGLIELTSRRISFVAGGIKSHCRASFFAKSNAIAYSRGSGQQMDIYRLDLESKKETQITQLPGREYDVEVLPDDKNLFFVHESTPGSNNFQIYFLNLAAGEPRQLTNNGGQIRYLSWTEN